MELLLDGLVGLREAQRIMKYVDSISVWIIKNIISSFKNLRNSMKFEGTKSYIATEDLKVAVNAAITLENNFVNPSQNH